MVIGAGVLFPESFITSFPVIGSEWSYPLTLLLPVVPASAYIIWRARGSLGFFPVDALILVFSAYLLARNISESPGVITKYVLYGLVVYYLTAVLARDKGNQRTIFLSVSILLIITVVYAVVEYAVQQNFIFQDHISVGEPPGSTHRVASFLAHPVVYAAFLVQALPFAIFLWVRGWKTTLRITGLVTSLSAIVCLILTQSKGSWIAALLVGIAATGYFAKTRGKKSLTVALVVVLLAGMAAGIVTNRSSFEDILRIRTSVDVRVTAWRAALDGIEDNLLLGVGFKQGQQEVVEQIPDNWKQLSGFSPPADNYYLNVFLEDGLIGGLLWVAMMVLIIVDGYRLVMQKREARYMLVAAYLSIVGLMISMVTFDALLIPSNRIMFWVAAGILRGQYLAADRSENASGPLSPNHQLTNVN